MESNKGLLRCKIVVVGDAQCGKTALLHVFAKNSYPEDYIPTVFENYTASFEIDKQRIELNMWDTSGKNDKGILPLCNTNLPQKSLIFDTFSLHKSWQGETQEFCPGAKVVLVGCKLDLRTDLNVMRELSKHRLIPCTHEQGTTLARQMGAVAYAECTSKYSENSVRDVFHVTTLASVSRVHRPPLKRCGSRRGLKRVSQQPARTAEIHEHPPAARKDRAKSCVLM
uniref:Rho family GTPase 2 n=1 Tax=Gasterosteus aculeatus aculeatus TaxID=481459 RepID=A0AAQ4Q1D5_GASAC